MNLLISFSGGRTSAYMLWWLMHEWKDIDKYNIKVVFANTGKEQEGTLEFIERCSNEFGTEIIWIESYPRTKKGWGVNHKVVDFYNASRNGEPFEEMIKVLGIPSNNAPFCSYQLKKIAIESYLKSINWNEWLTAIGIRIDEVDRVNKNWKTNNILYPLISLKPTTKKDIILWWSKQPFDLKINPDLGNCNCCWKKDIKRLCRIAKNTPKEFDWWQEMTNKYGHIQKRKATKNMKPPFNFYRGNLSPKNIIDMSNLEIEQINMFAENEKLDGCSESCEVF